MINLTPYHCSLQTTSASRSSSRPRSSPGSIMRSTRTTSRWSSTWPQPPCSPSWSPVWYWRKIWIHRRSVCWGAVSWCTAALVIDCVTRLTNASTNAPSFHTVHLVTFGIFGLLGIIPTFHYHYLTEVCFTAIPAMILIAFFYIVGILIYFFRIPERWSTKNRFDLIGSSHNFFHLSVIAGSLTHYYALATLANERISTYRNHCKTNWSRNKTLLFSAVN